MKKVIVIAGDGIGPEITDEAVKVLSEVIKDSKEEITFNYHLFGGASIDEYGIPFNDKLKLDLEGADAVLLGAVGGPKWDLVDSSIRPEKGLLEIRKHMGLFCNLRPIKVYKSLKHKSPVKLKSDIDFMIVRELTGGIYFGEKKNYEKDGEKFASDAMTYSESEIKRISKWAIKVANERKTHLTLVDKANVLESSKLWRKTIESMEESKSVDIDYMYVDNAAMQLILGPEQFGVVLTSNMFGDILSDAGGAVTGSIGLLPSASLSDSDVGLYEPIHGSAPDIAGQNIANPLGTILSTAMMLRHSFHMDKEAIIIEMAVENTINAGILSKELAGDAKSYSTSEIGNYVVEEIRKII
ncbi:MAG: 3-isopropylmalate dehydrogenase [Acidaminobacteraceae bacterium]